MALPDTYILLPGVAGPTKMRAVDSGDGVSYALATSVPTGGGGGTVQPGNTPNTVPWLTNHSDPAATTGTITVIDSGTSTAAGQGGQSLITGTPTAQSSVQATLNANNAFAIQILFGSATGTVAFERSIDGGTTWTPMSLPLYGVTGPSVSSVTGSCILHGAAGANTQIRVRATGAVGGSGGISVRILPSFGVSTIGAGLLPGEQHIGQAGGHTASITPTLAVSTTPAYSSGDNVGGKLTLSNVTRISGGTAIAQSLLVIDASNQKAALDIVIFNADPTNTTFTDNSALTINSADVAKIIRRISVAASDYVTIGGVAIAEVAIGGKPLIPASGSTLYAAAVTTSTPTYAATTALIIRLGVLQD